MPESSISPQPDHSSASPQRLARKKNSKACETCRVRKIRCVGGVPCDPCRAGGRQSRCDVRQKARPNRLPAKSQMQGQASKQEPSPTTLPPSLVKLTDPSPTPRLPLLNYVQMGLIHRCLEHQIALDKLKFEDELRLSRIQLSTLPAPTPSAEVEEDLIQTFVRSPEFDIIQVVDREELLRIFSRYRITPNSVTQDQLALIYAAFCLAKHNKITMNTFTPIGWQSAITGESLPVDDVTFFFTAKRLIVEWHNPSIFLLWAICTLLPYVMLKGGASECCELLERMAWHVKELGIYRPETAALFPPQDAADGVFSTFVYYDTFISGLMATTPLLLTHDLMTTISPIPSLYPGCLQRVTVHELDFLNHTASHDIDAEYAEEVQRIWTATMRDMRRSPDLTVGQNLRNWAELRYCWLRILLHAPRLVDPSPFADPMPILARCVSQMLNIYTEADSIGHFRESWQQFRQLTTCAQLLILTTSAGEYHRLEAVTLWNMLVRFLERLTIFWPKATTVVTELRRAASVFGIALEPSLVAPDVNDLQQLPLDASSIFDGFGTMLPFNFA